MKALVTAGGRGTRLRPITHTQNKHLIPVANTPILFYAFENLRAAGITDIGVIVSPETLDELRAAIDGAALGIHPTYIIQEEPRGLADCIRRAEGFLGHEPFVFYLGDNMVVGGIARFLERFRAGGYDCFLTLARVPHPERFGVPTLDRDRIVAVTEKPARPASPFAVAGIYLYTAAIFDAVKALAPSARGEYEISDAHQWLLDHGRRVGYDEITGWWKDTGTPQDLLEANRFVLEHRAPPDVAPPATASELSGTVIVGEGSAIRGSRIRGPVIVGRGCTIDASYIGPYTALGDGTQVVGSEVEYSILLERCTIRNVGRRIEGSILGIDTVVTQSTGTPRVHRLMVGDQSRIEIV